jgi:hypothetical protein
MTDVTRILEPKPVAREPGRVPRVSRLLAPALRIDEQVRKGELTSYSGRHALIAKLLIAKLTCLGGSGSHELGINSCCRGQVRLLVQIGLQYSSLDSFSRLRPGLRG